MLDLERAKEKLKSGDYTCVLCKGDRTLALTQRGIKPLVELYEGDENFEGFCAADKVVGKGAAFLYLLLGVKAIYSAVLSRSALELLQKNGVIVRYDILAENIINRKGDGICPFEEAVLNIGDKLRAYLKIKEKMAEMNI